MADGSNMICPGCGTFQPRAEVCKKCGIIIAKATVTGAKPSVQTAATAASSKPPVAMIILAAVIAIPVIGFFLFPDGDKQAATTAETAPAPAKTGAQAQIERIAVVKPGVANELQRTQVQSKLNSLRTRLNVYLAENEQPPSNEEGLQTLVDKGDLTPADIIDEWGNAFVYRVEWGQDTALEKKYTIFLSSKGPDGIAGNADDIGI